MKIYINKSKAKPSYCVAWTNPETGERERKTFVDPIEANRHLDTVKKYAAVVDGIKKDLTPLQITNFGIQQKRLGDTPINVAVDYYLTNYKKEITTPKFTDLAQEYLTEKKSQVLDPGYVKIIEGHLQKANERFSVPIGAITRDDLQLFLNENWSHPITKNNVRRTLVGLFRWAKIKKRVLPNDYETAPEAVTPYTVAAVDPDVYSPEELENILKLCWKQAPLLLPFITTAAFTGIRIAEILRIDWHSIDWGNKIIPLSANITKTKNRRLVPIPDCMLAWLGKLGPAKELQMPKNPQAMLNRLLGDTPHKKNGFRHSFISYHLALHNNIMLTSQICGNSPTIIDKHYKSIQLDDGRFITKDLAEKWFSIVP